MICIANIEPLYRLRHACSKDATRYVLTGIHIEPWGEDSVRASATDGKMLACTILDASFDDEDNGAPPSVTIPVDAVKDRHSRIIIEDRTVRTLEGVSYPLIEGKYPDYGFLLREDKLGTRRSTGRLDYRLLARAAKVFGIRERGSKPDLFPDLFALDDDHPAWGVHNGMFVAVMPLVDSNKSNPSVPPSVAEFRSKPKPSKQQKESAA